MKVILSNSELVFDTVKPHKYIEGDVNTTYNYSPVYGQWGYYLSPNANQWVPVRLVQFPIESGKTYKLKSIAAPFGTRLHYIIVSSELDIDTLLEGQTDSVPVNNGIGYDPNPETEPVYGYKEVEITASANGYIVTNIKADDVDVTDNSIWYLEEIEE